MREKRALFVSIWFFGWDSTPATPITISDIIRGLKAHGWGIALLTLSGDALHPDFLSEDKRREEFLKAIPDVPLYAAKGGFISPLALLKYLMKRGRISPLSTNARKTSFTTQGKRRAMPPTLRKLIFRIGRFSAPFWRGYVYSRRQMVREGLRVIADFKPSIIVSASGVPEDLSTAARLSSLTDIPWIALVHDPLFGPETIYRRWLNTTSAVIADYSDSWDFKGRNVPLYVIYSGFDPAKYPTVPLLPQFTATGIARRYDSPYHWLLLLRALARLKKDGITRRFPLRVRLYCLNPRPILEDWIKKFELGNIVELHPPIPHSEMLKRECESALLLFAMKRKEQYATRFWEFIGAGRPIFYIGPHGPVLEMLRKLGAGFTCETE